MAGAAAGAAAGAFGAMAASFSFAFCIACMSHQGQVKSTAGLKTYAEMVCLPPMTFVRATLSLCDQQCINVQVSIYL